MRKYTIDYEFGFRNGEVHITAKVSDGADIVHTDHMHQYSGYKAERELQALKDRAEAWIDEALEHEVAFHAFLQLEMAEDDA
jgi:hypothetical protein